MKIPTISVGTRTAFHHLHRDSLPVPPLLPRLRHGIRPVNLPDGIQFDGGPEREVLRGPATRRLLPRLLPLLNGARDVAELAEAVGSDAAVIERVVALLHIRGLLEEGGPTPTGTPSAQALARLGATTWVDSHAGQTLDRLATARVALHGAAPHLSVLAGALREAGTGTVVMGGPEPCPADLAVVLLGPHSMAGDAAERLSEAYARDSVALLPWFVAGPVSVIGPLLTPELDLCLSCLRLELRGADSTTLPGTADLWAETHGALACREVLALLAHVPPAHSPNGATRYDLGAWTTEQAMPTAHPSCPACHPQSAAAATEAHTSHPPSVPAAGRPLDADPITVAARYHQAISKPALHRITPKAHLQSLDPRFRAWTKERRQWPSAALLPLPALPAPGTPWGPAPDTGAPAGPGAPALADLALLLGMTAGPRGPRENLEFWAPSGGNLGSPCLYLAARGIDGLADGAYGYDALAHSLARLADLPAVDLLAGPHTSFAVLAMTGDVPRIQRKYGPFALNLACLDAGVALTQIETVAGLLGHRVTLHDDLPAPDVAALTDAFLIDSGREPVTAVLSLARAAAPRCRQSPGQHPPALADTGYVHPEGA
ncbi:hypothetical protein ACWDG1_41130 [Streptomyces sp. NPDC001177]